MKMQRQKDCCFEFDLGIWRPSSCEILCAATECVRT